MPNLAKIRSLLDERQPRCTLPQGFYIVYLGSAGSCEGNALSSQELRRVYEIGVSVGKGKVQVNANPPV